MMLPLMDDSASIPTIAFAPRDAASRTIFIVARSRAFRSMSVVSANAARLLQTGALVIAVVILHNLLGYALGYGVGRVLGLNRDQMRTLSIEVGMQNSGLAVALATTHFAAMPMATIPGAVFSVWHNISGAVYANILARTAGKGADAPKVAAAKN